VGIRSLGDSIQFDFYYRGLRVRPSKPIRPTARNMRWATEYLARIRDKIARDEFSWWDEFPDSKYCEQFEPQLTVRQALEDWLEQIARAGLAHSTLYGYQKSVRNKLIPALGDLRLNELTTEKLHAFVDSLEVAAKTKSEVMVPLRKTVKHCLRVGLFKSDPLLGFTVSDDKPQQSEVTRAIQDDEVFSEKERRLIKANTDNWMFWEFAWWTGLRVSELIALKWTSVDMVNERVEITEARVLGREKGPKTRSSNRFVRLLPPALAAVRAQRQISQLKSKYLWLNPRTGRPYHDNQAARKELEGICRRAGLARKLPKFTRHTYGSMMLAAGEPLVWVSNQLGHRDVLTTARRYVRFMPDGHVNAGLKAVEKWV